MKTVSIVKKITLLSIILMSSILISCGGNDEDCLGNGENCSQGYIDDNYNGVRPPCCNDGDICQTSPSGFYLTCN